MKNPHIRTLPSHSLRYMGANWVSARLYDKRLRRDWRVWLRGEGPKPDLNTLFDRGIGSIQNIDWIYE